jgi:hypothetical protein
MASIVSLKQVADALDSASDETTVYLNRVTGQTYLVVDEDYDGFQSDEDVDESEDGSTSDLPEWQRKDRQKRREIEGSDDWLALPGKFDIDEYQIMRDFARSMNDRQFREDLLDTIGGRGTFGRFKGMLARHGKLDAWFAFRSEALIEITRDWLEENGVEYGP